MAPAPSGTLDGAGGCTDGCSPEEPAYLCPPCRLEMTLRGTFVDQGGTTEDADDDDDDRSGNGSASAESDDVLTPLPGPTPAAAFLMDDALREADIRRERMGFGRLEFGAAPTGRTSVPAVRGGSAPPPTASSGEGIELGALGELLQRHVRRVLARGLGGSCRAASCELSVESCTEPCRPASCPSPTGPPCPSERQPRAKIDLRLCRTRCGSSCAVLQLTLGHVDACSPSSGCQCQPPPQAAAAQLMTHFARHSLLRLTTTRPPVRVLLEPLE